MQICVDCKLPTTANLVIEEVRGINKCGVFHPLVVLRFDVRQDALVILIFHVDSEMTESKKREMRAVQFCYIYSYVA